MSDIISAPNVYLYAFQLQRNSKGSNNPLWKHCDNILANFTDERVTPNLVFPQNSHSNRNDLLPNVSLGFNSYPPIEGFVQPLQIQKDSYAFCLNIGCPEDGTADNVDVDLIQKFNPNQALLIDGDDNFLGQTLLITAWLPENSSDNLDALKPLADNCRNALFQGDSLPPFYCSGKLFGSPIFEYGSIIDIANYRHLLVWLLVDKQTDENFNTCQEEIFDLLFYRNKIIKVFQDSRLIYDELDREYGIIEKNVEILQAQFSRGTLLTAAQLQEFQEQLKQLFSKAVTYTRLLRKLEDYDNTIALNLNNYTDILQKICDILGTDKEELSILNNFSRKTAPYMRSQIAGDLGYFRHGTNLIDQAIASIRGIVEIEQARSDRTNQLALRNSEDKEKYRDDRLQSTVQAIGVGLAAGGIAASSGTDKLFETVQNHHIPVVMHLHPFAFSFLLSCAIALVATSITWCLTKPKNS
ncbi:MAG: hypothetical protein JGK30_23955 [Microcoleus sp. PH2017_40_RAT_O_B]|uniref:hypothetical protein n=1 Tax=unclassified Microcoleus TaxID=2642155 RepID=UPI001D65446D|nr:MULTISPECIES: hypothetical protein [unclassified Microcoleus]MCC3574795.1 hypothetical protein [Microcoleus sp. PH2017_34_RAT_O_A]MCC3612445.1 hypothetical protein [Microcoleus sp. PH2017_40_RAT_O_B]